MFSHGDNRPIDSCVTRYATNGERRVLLLCGLEGSGWWRRFQLRDEVKPPFFVVSERSGGRRGWGMLCNVGHGQWRLRGEG